ncbi:MAG: hypothetical protein AB1458_00140 [Bacteroidota bacterium]
MKHLLLLPACLLCLHLSGQENTGNDSASGKIMVSVFAGNTALTDRISERYYFPGFPQLATGKEGLRLNTGLELGFRLRKDLFFTMHWSLSIYRYSETYDTRNSTSTVSGSDYSIRESRAGQLSYQIKPGISANLYETERLIVSGGISVPFVAMGKYAYEEVYTSYVSGSLWTKNRSTFENAGSYSAGLGVSGNIKYLPCGNFFLSGTVSGAALFSWSDSDWVQYYTDLIGNAPATVTVSKQSLRDLGITGLYGSLGAGFRF